MGNLRKGREQTNWSFCEGWWYVEPGSCSRVCGTYPSIFHVETAIPTPPTLQPDTPWTHVHKGQLPRSVSVGFTAYSQVDMLGLWHKSFNFGAEQSLGSPNWSAQIDSDRAKTFAAVLPIVGLRRGSTWPEGLRGQQMPSPRPWTMIRYFSASVRNPALS